MRSGSGGDAAAVRITLVNRDGRASPAVSRSSHAAAVDTLHTNSDRARTDAVRSNRAAGPRTCQTLWRIQAASIAAGPLMPPTRATTGYLRMKRLRVTHSTMRHATLATSFREAEPDRVFSVRTRMAASGNAWNR